ncbi:MAG: OmpP1/FadL family transporter [Myxococcota bacterium]
MNTANRISIGLLAAGLLTLPSVAFGAGFQNTSQSASANAMANAAVANEDEGNASFYNPAYMTQNEGLRLYVGDTIIAPSTTYDPEGGGDTISTEAQIFPPPNFHLQYRFGENLAAGVGMTFSYGLGIAWPDGWVGRENIISQDLQTANITPVVAYEIDSANLSVAAGAQIIRGTVELNQDVALPHDQFVRAQLGGGGFGFGAIAALYYEPTDDISVGFNYRSRATVNFDEGAVHFDGEEDTPLYSTFQDNTGTTEITLPDTFSLGVGYQLSDLYLEFDVNYTLWETYDQIVLDIDNEEDPRALGELRIVNNWENALAFRLGAKYDVTENLPIRLGVAYDRSPIPDETVNASLPGNDRISGAIGTGYTFAGFRADIGYQLVSAMTRDVQNDRAPNGEYKTTAHVLGINVGYGF